MCKFYFKCANLVHVGGGVYEMEEIKSRIDICDGPVTIEDGCRQLLVVVSNCNTKIVNSAAGAVFKKWLSDNRVRRPKT